MTKVLVTGAGGPAGRALSAQFAALAGRAVTWIGVDISPVSDDQYNGTDRMPRADDMAYAAGLRDLIERHHPDLVIPTVQDELPEIAVLASLFGPSADYTEGTRILGSAPGPTAVAADKLLTMWALQRGAVPVPKFAPATAVHDAAEALQWGGGPVVVKPRLSRGGRGVHLVERADGLEWHAFDAGWILQSFAGGTEYSPQVYRSPVTGEITVVVLEKTELKQGRVGNAAAVVRLADDAVPDVREMAAQVVQVLDLVGPVDMDIRRDIQGNPVVLEVNSRFGANSAYAPELLESTLAEWPRTP